MSLRDSSKKQWSTRGPKATVEEIQCGSLQRIADAVELMAKDRASLEARAKLYEDLYSVSQSHNASLRRSNAALRGVITRMKKQAEPKRVVMVSADGSEAVYVDGVLMEWDDTIYMADLAACVEPARHAVLSILFLQDAPEEWPESLEDVEVEQ